MAFTPAQISSVITHLNYPAQQWAISWVTQALGRVTDLSSALETDVIAIIDELDSLQSAIATHVTTLAGTQVDTLGNVYYSKEKTEEMEFRYSYLVSRLCAITQLVVHVDGSLRSVKFG